MNCFCTNYYTDCLMDVERSLTLFLTFCFDWFVPVTQCYKDEAPT